MVSADYIVGLTDGEGCFYVNVRERNSRWSPKVETHFYIKLKNDDKKLLEEIKESFGCGAVYFQKENRPNHSPCYRFGISSQRDINEVLVPFFEQHSLHSSKKKDFGIFRHIVHLVQCGEHKTEQGLARIKNLKMQMNGWARRMREIRTSGGNAK